MTANAKPVSARPRLAKAAAIAASILPMCGLMLTSSAATAGEPIAFAAPAAPLISVAVTPVLGTATPALSVSEVAEPVYQTIASGIASYYGRELAGNRTASGERFNPSALTAAHRTLPLGSKVRVTNPRTGDSVIVRINDRGPFHGKRLIDLSEAAARQIGIRAAGSGSVDLAVQTD